MPQFKVEDLYLNRAKFVMKILGVWLPSADEINLQRYYRHFMVFLQYIFLFFELVYVVQVWGDLESVSQASYLLFTQACLCLKITVFLGKKEELMELLRHMNSNIFFPQHGEQDRVVQWHATRVKRLLMAFLVSAQSTCALWALKPLFDDAGAREFPFRMWMPVDPLKSPQYQLGFVFQYVTISLSAYMYFGVDSVALSMVVFSCAQLDIIKNKILQIKNITMQDRENKKTLNRLLDENYKMFIDCVLHHQAIAGFIKLVEDTYHTYILFQLSGSVGLLCMSALLILVVDWNSMQFISIINYLLSMVMQLYICCWCGHELTATSEELFVVLTQCPWYEQDVRFKRALRFTMMRLARPLVFRAGRYIPLSRQTFVSILRTSYSYFAVLRQTT